MFAYLRKEVMVNERIVMIRVSIKKKVGTNHFHIHHIDTNEKNLELLRPSKRTEVFEIQDSVSSLIK